MAFYFILFYSILFYFDLALSLSIDQLGPHRGAWEFLPQLITGTRLPISLKMLRSTYPENKNIGCSPTFSITFMYSGGCSYFWAACWLKTTFVGRRPLVEDNLWWKMTFGGRWPLVKVDRFVAFFNTLFMYRKEIIQVWRQRALGEGGRSIKCLYLLTGRGWDYAKFCYSRCWRKGKGHRAHKNNL